MTLVERRTTTDVAEGDPEYTGAAEPGTSRPELRLVLLFLAIGAATTILHLGAFAALREQWSAQWSNTAAPGCRHRRQHVGQPAVDLRCHRPH